MSEICGTCAELRRVAREHAARQEDFGRLVEMMRVVLRQCLVAQNAAERARKDSLPSADMDAIG